MTDARQFNIRDEEGRTICPACGFPNYAYRDAYTERGGLIGVTICPACFWEPGFDDHQLASAAAKDTIMESLHAYRAEWSKTLEWRGYEERKPDNWDAKKHLDHLFELAPHLR